MTKGLPARERRRQANRQVASIRISEAISERIDTQVERRRGAANLPASLADKAINRAAIMREALERGLAAMEADGVG